MCMFPRRHSSMFVCIVRESSSYPIGSMYGMFTYIWLDFMVNVGRYTIHGASGYVADHVFPC